MQNKFKGIASLLLATIIWGSAFIAQSVGMDYMGPFTFQAVRGLLAVAALLLLIGLRDLRQKGKKPFFGDFRSKKLWKAGILCGIPLFLASNLQQVGLVNTDPGKSAFLTAMYIVMVPILGIFLGKRPSRMIPISALLAVVGLYCLSCVGVTSVSPGDLFLLACALMFAVQILMVERFAGDTDPLALNLIQCLVCTVLSGIVMFAAEAPVWSQIVSCWLPLCYAGILSLGIAFSLQILGQRHLESASASLIMSLESAFALLFGWILLGDTLTLWEGIGCALVFLAVILSQIPTKELSAPKPAQKAQAENCKA